MDKDFFNQRIQKFSRQFCGIDILFHQTYPLFSVNRCLGGGLHRFVKPFNFYVQFSLFALILFGQHIEIVFCNASGRPVLIHFCKQGVYFCFALFRLFQFGCLPLPCSIAFLVAGVK